MKKILYSAFMLTCFYNPSKAQNISMTLLDTNNMGAIVNDNGALFHDYTLSSSGYEFMSGSGKNLIYSSGFWFGGRDVNNQLKFAGLMYDTSGYFGTGPLTINTAQPMNQPMEQTIWIVSVNQIQNHINNFQNESYVIPENIASWPAHGDTNLGFSQNLAPFVDVDNDGVYVPENGDYPCIKGDKAAYMILNDKSGNSHTENDPIGLELHYLIYQFVSIPELLNTTFIDLKVINRSTQTLYDFYASYFVDGDLGNYMDDYIGCDTSRNMGFYYNMDNFDEDNAGHIGFGENPPAFGVLSLNKSLDRFSGLPENGFLYVQQMYSLMDGYWTDGTSFTDNNGLPTSYYYPGNPLISSEWSELSSGNSTNDRRFLMTHDETTLVPNQVLEYSYALIIANDSVSPAENVNVLYTIADQTQDFFDNNLNYSCYETEASLFEQNEANFRVLPNPNKGTFEIETENRLSAIEVTITDLSGRIVFAKKYGPSDSMKISLKENSGIYFVKLKSEKDESFQRIIIE